MSIKQQAQVRGMRLDVYAKTVAFNQLQQSGVAMPQLDKERSEMPDAQHLRQATPLYHPRCRKSRHFQEGYTADGR